MNTNKILRMLSTLLFGAVTVFLLWLLNRLFLRCYPCQEVHRVTGKLAVVTGAESGIGLETAAELARRGATVILACRNAESGREAVKEILRRYGEGVPTALTSNAPDPAVQLFLTVIKPKQLIVEELDLSSLDSVRLFAERVNHHHQRIDFLINNASVMYPPYGLTNEGFELQMGINHLSHFLLTELLLPSIQRAAPGSRIIYVSSLAHRFGKVVTDYHNPSQAIYRRMVAYADSKLANVIHAHQLARRLADVGILTASLHPGAVMPNRIRTPILKEIIPWILKPFLKTSWEGAQTTLHTILTENLTSGSYYADCTVATTNPLVLDKELATRFYEESCKAVGLTPQIPPSPQH